MVPRPDESTYRRLGPVGDERIDDVGAVVEVDVARHFPLGILDVDFRGGYPVLGNPGKSVVNGPNRFVGDDDDLMLPAEVIEGVDSPRIGIQVSEQGVSVVVPRPRPELTHVFEVGEAGYGVPGLDRVRRQLGAVIQVVPPDPSGVEVSDNPVEIDT